MKTKTKKDRDAKSLGAELIGKLFTLLDDAWASDVPFRIDYDVDEGGTITICIDLADPNVTNAAEELGFTIARGGRIAGNIYRAAEAYLVCDEPDAVFAMRAWMHFLGANAHEDGSMALEYQPDAPESRTEATMNN